MKRDQRPETRDQNASTCRKANAARYSFVSVCVLAVISIAFLRIPAACAAPDLGIFEFGQSIQLSQSDPQTIIANLINEVLKFVGILLLLMILWGGFLYMLSGGDDEKTKKATAVIRNAIIGVVIILCAWAVARFALTSLLQATGGG